MNTDSGQPVADEERPDSAPKEGCYGCGRQVGPKGARGWHPQCFQRAKNAADTGDVKQRRVWRISRHQRRRLTGVSRSRAGR